MDGVGEACPEDLVAADRLLAAVTAFHEDLVRKVRGPDLVERQTGQDHDTLDSEALRNRERRIAATTGWNSSTATVRSIRDSLAARTPGAEEAVWLAVDGTRVAVGHEVALDLTPDTVGVIEGVHAGSGLPCVRIVRGPGVGRVVYPYPGQILTRVHRS